MVPPDAMWALFLLACSSLQLAQEDVPRGGIEEVGEGRQTLSSWWRYQDEALARGDS